MTFCSSSFRFAGVSCATKIVFECHRTPEGFGLKGNDRERFFQGDVVEFDMDLLRGVIGIEKHVHAGQLADRLVNHVGFLGDLEGNGHVR